MKRTNKIFLALLLHCLFSGFSFGGESWNDLAKKIQKGEFFEMSIRQFFDMGDNVDDDLLLGLKWEPPFDAGEPNLVLFQRCRSWDPHATRNTLVVKEFRREITMKEARDLCEEVAKIIHLEGPKDLDGDMPIYGYRIEVTVPGAKKPFGGLHVVAYEEVRRIQEVLDRYKKMLQS